MPAQPNFYNDGPWTTGINYGFDRVTYPFINNPQKDVTSKIYEVSRAILPANYAPQAALSTYSGNSVAYLVEETDLQIDEMGRARYLLRYANVPLPQVLPASRVIARPVMHGTAFGTNYAVSYDQGFTSTIFQNPAVATVVAVANGFQITLTSHGAQPGDYYAAWANGSLTAFGKIFATPTANTFTCWLSDSLTSGAPAVTNAAIAKISAFGRYVNGALNCTIRKTQKFYLPNVTPGITTFADIPLQTPNMDPVSWMGAILTNQAWTVESVTELASWMGPIVYQEVNEVQMSDAKDTVNVVS